jgi:hypothetical protein
MKRRRGKPTTLAEFNAKVEAALKFCLAMRALKQKPAKPASLTPTGPIG